MENNYNQNNSFNNYSTVSSHPAQDVSANKSQKNRYTPGKIISMAISGVLITAFSVFLLIVFQNLPSPSIGLDENIHTIVNGEATEVEALKIEKNAYISIEKLSKLFEYQYSVNGEDITITTPSRQISFKFNLKTINIKDLETDTVTTVEISSAPVVEDSAVYISIEDIKLIFESASAQYDTETNIVRIEFSKGADKETQNAETAK